MSRLPALTSRQLVAALKRAGFIEHHQESSHLSLVHPLSGRVAVVPMHAKDLKRGTMMGILRQAGLSRDEFGELL